MNGFNLFENVFLSDDAQRIKKIEMKNMASTAILRTLEKINRQTVNEQR
jgi:hypothetical protein